MSSTAVVAGVRARLEERDAKCLRQLRCAGDQNPASAESLAPTCTLWNWVPPSPSVLTIQDFLTVMNPASGPPLNTICGGLSVSGFYQAYTNKPAVWELRVRID